MATFHTVFAVIGAIFATMPIIHVSIGIMMVATPQAFQQGDPAQPPTLWAGVFFIFIGGLFVLLGWAAAVCTFVSGRYLRLRRKRMFSFVMACILCMFMPFGTVLGIITIIMLSRDSVRRLYGDA